MPVLSMKKKKFKEKDEHRCPHCHDLITRPDEHLNHLSHRYRCGDQWIGNDI